MKTSKILRVRHLAVVVLALSLTLTGAGRTVPVALGYYADGPVSASAARHRLAENTADGLHEENPSATLQGVPIPVPCGLIGDPNAGNPDLLIAAINLANGNSQPDTINLVAGCVFTLDAEDNNTDGPNGLPSILSDGGSSLTINGNGAIIERDPAAFSPFRIFHVSSEANLTLNNLIISEGWVATEAGGGIYNKGTLTLNGSTVDGNDTVAPDLDGGGIYNEGTLTLNDSTISNNSTGDGSAGTEGGDGGGIYNAAGAHLMILSSSTVSDNVTGAVGGDGGGIYNEGTLTLNDGTVKDNATGDDDGDGGGIYNAADAHLTLTSSTVISNTAGTGGGDGGGIYSTGTVTVTSSSSVTGNATSDGDGDGGGIYNAGVLTLNESTISGNSTGDGDDSTGTAGGNGGGVYNATDAHLTLTSSTVSDNATGAGGDHASAQAGHGGHGGGIYSTGTLTVTNSTVSGNATGAGGSGATTGGDGGDGAGIYNVETLTLSSSTVVSNTTGAGGAGGVAGSDGLGGGVYHASTTTVTNTIMANNSEGGQAGTQRDCHVASGTITSGGYNLVENPGNCIFSSTGDITATDPQLGPLSESGGGPTETHTLLPGSPAIDVGGDCAATDQRGVARPQDGDDDGTETCDIGAYERRYVPLWTVTTTADGSGTVDDACSLREAIQALNTNQDFGGCLIETGNYTITLVAGTYELTIAGPGEDDNATGDLDVKTDLIIDGAGAITTTIDANDLVDRVLHIHDGVTVELRGVNLTEGWVGGGGLGGGIYNEDGTLTLNDSTVSHSYAHGSGGGIYHSVGTLTLNNSTIISNTAGGHGGGIFNDDTMSITDGTVSGNSAQHGGGIENAGALTLTNSTVSNNFAQYGGGVYSDAGTLTVADSTVSGNEAESDGGGIENGGAGTLTLTNSTVSGNDAGDCGGGIFNSGQVTVTNSSLVGTNTADQDGGGIYNDGGTLSISASSVSDNSTEASGGGIYSASDLTVEGGSELSRNSAGDSGGGIYSDGNLTLTASTVSENSAGDGGGITSSGTVTVTQGSVISNTAQLKGGGIHNTGGLKVEDSSMISGNSAQSGGGIYHSTSTLTLTNSTVSDNTATQDGGGIVNANGTLTASSSIVNGNSAGHHGGGVDNAEGTLTLTDSTVHDNQAQFGGGIANRLSSTLTLTDSTIRDNSSEYGGGVSNDGDTTVTQSTLVGNAADFEGGGIRNSGTTALINSTISANSADWGGGIYNHDGSADIQFATIAGNSAVQGGANVYNEEGKVVTLLATIIAEPQGKPNCAGDGLTSAEGGFNRISDTSCQLQSAPDDDNKENAVIQLLPLDDYGGPTLTHKPIASLDNEVVDIMSGTLCIQVFEPDEAIDQRGKHRPSIGVRVEGVFASPDDAPCDAGAVELRTSVQRVCGPPLAHTNAAGEFVVEPEFVGRCYWPTIADALQQTEDGDTIIISGVVTETVTVDKSITIQGPTRDEITPGTHMGIVQAALDEPDGSRTRGSVFSIPYPISVTIKNLNIRHGDADTGGGIKNGGRLTLEGVTIYDNAANRGGAIYNSGTLTVENSSLLDNLGENGGAGIYNAAAGPDDDGLALWLPFNEAAGATEFADESGNGLDASCSAPGCPTAGVDGRHANAVRFDGSDDRAGIADTPYIDGLQQLTVAAWVKLNSLPNRVMRFVTLGHEKAVIRYDGSQYGGPRQLHFYLADIGGIEVNNALSAGTWLHVAGTYDGSTMRVYLNGVELDTYSPTDPPDVRTGDGILLSSPGETLDGLLDDVVIYDRALSGEEIEALFYAGDGTARVTHATLADNVIPGWTPSTISSDTNGAYSVYAVDMDEDGDPDVFSASRDDDKIAWHENAGAGNGTVWAAHVITTTANSARSVYVANVDGDGDLDVLSASHDDDKIAWYENTDGDGTAWTSHTIVDENSIIPSSRADGAMSVFAADVDGDGDTDVLSASENDDKIAWYENRLDEIGCVPAVPETCWIPNTISTAADGAQSVYAADIDGDGNVDVFSASYNDNKIAWYENTLDDAGCTLWTPANCWSAHTVSIAADGARSVYVADVDGDGDLDALSASQDDDKIAWYENTSGTGAAWTTHIIVDTHSGADRADGARSVYAVDVDGDGDLDALSASYNDNKIAWYENVDGDGAAWTAHTITTAANGARSVFAALVDEDDNVDVLSASFSDDEIVWYDNPIGAVGSSIYNANAAAGSVTVSGTILQSAGLVENQCFGEVTTGGYNLLHGGTCFALGGTDITGDPQLGPLRDNGGPTLTRALSTADSAAVEAGPFEVDCAVETDQRGKARPFDSPGGGGARCDIGAVEYGADTLLVWECEEEECESDPENLRFIDLQEALHYAMAGDVIAVEAGAYTGNFTAYKNATLQHAGINVATLSQDQPVGVRAILQASGRTIREQHRLLDETQTDGLSGTVLTIEAYEYPAGPTSAIAVTDDVTVTLRGLTIRHGLSRQGGGIYNVGHLYVYTSTISENAAVNGLQGTTVVTEAMGGAIYNLGELTLERSTVSGNQSEFYGGAIYNDGSDFGGIPATVEVDFSTIAENRAEKIGAQRVVNIKDAGFDPDTLTVDSGDYIQFRDQTSSKHVLDVSVDGDGECNLTEVDVPRQGGGLSKPLICSACAGSLTVTITDREDSSLSMDIEVSELDVPSEAHSLYISGSGEISIRRSILVNSSCGGNCGFGGMGSLIQSGGYNLADDDSCRLTKGTDLEESSDAQLGPLQDNNAIDFVNNWISGYTYSHALKPGSSAMDRIPPDECGAATQHTIDIASGSLDLTIEAGDVVKWAYTADSTVALDDGEANVNLVAVPADGQSREVQFNEPGDYPYRVYANDTRSQIGAGVIEVASRVRAVDQRGTVLPQRGTGDTYRCDIGAYEFEPWVVGQPLSRPPAAVGTQPPKWRDGEGTELGLSYHAWSSATAQDYPLRPSPNDGDADLEPPEIIAIYWETNPDPVSQVEMALYGIVEWPSDPQIHVSGAPVQLTHDDVSDGFRISDAQAFEGREPADDEAGQLVSVGVFTRTALVDIAGDSYSVLQFVKGNQANPTLKVQVVKTVDWNAPGVRDMRAERGVCEIGHEIRYRSYEDASGTLPGHEDAEDRPGQILLGEAFDGVRTEIDLARVQNTVDGLILPAHIRDAREGPIIPILNTAPTQLSGDLVTGDHDLRIAWYRPDERDVAWPVKTVGYRCDWPADPPEIVIASELGSEIGGQPVLNPEGYGDVTVYHQPDPDEPGYNPNDEHAMLASSNLGNSAPALYALRSDLAEQPYALLKYRDPREDDQTKIAVYKVVLTREAEEITDIIPDSGVITLLAGAGGGGADFGDLQDLWSLASTSVTVRVGDGELPPGGDVTVLVEALGAENLRSATIKVSYDTDVLTPTACATNRLDFVERLYGLQITTDQPAQPYHVVKLRADLDAGTDAQYEWDFGDDTSRIAGSEVSHVYGAVGTYTVTVTASNGVFDDVTATTQVEIADDAIPGSLDDDDTIGCRIETDGELTIELKSRNKHGLSGNLTLTEVTFEAVGDPPAEDTETNLNLTSITLFGPGYEDLSYNITAGNPVFAPTPLRGLLDIQPCEQTQVKNPEEALPFWKDFKDTLWARAAGDMDVLYFYPLQAGFHLTDDHAESLGLVDENGDVLSPDEQVGKCVPWMDKLLGDQTGIVPHTITTEAGTARSVYAADVDGDDDADVLSASASDDKIAWYENDGTPRDGGWTIHTITTDADGAWSVYAADVDGDGDLDALSASMDDDKIAWYENGDTDGPGTGDGSAWTAHTITTDADGATSVYAADVDGDGDLDALSASGDDNKIAWYENTVGDGSAWTARTIATAYGAWSVYAADVDGDGDLDALSASVGDDKIAWYENTDSDGTTWTAHTISTAADGAGSVYAADVDRDGDLDALSASIFDDKIAWYQEVLPVAYHVDWPDLPPLLSVGETVYERAKSGISGVANQLAVSRIYDDLAPGAWNNVAQKIVIEGAEVQRSLAELIDPIGEVRVEVGITINDNPSLPEEIKTERLLFGGGLAIVGTTDNEITLPFALRTRILFDDIEGELIFRGYYDGTSPEYIKGDPLLLLNVMSLSDKQRLEALCQSGSADCQKYLDAIEELYHKTRNPRQVDLCRDEDGKLYADDADPATNQGTEDTNISTDCPEGTYRDGEPDHAFLIGVQDANDDGLPEPYEGLGKGKALTAGNAAGTGYITVVYNNDDSLGGLPVSLQVIQVGCTKNHLGEDSTYRGNLLVVKSDNLFDEKLTLRHTGDFGGQPDNFEFEWWIAEVDETAVSPAQLPPSYPWKKWTRLEPGADDIGPEITIEGANPTTLSDNWLIMRYKGCPVCGNQYRYSAFAGDPSAKPSEVRGQLAEGWIKRVVGALNPFDTRVDDFVGTPVNMAVDMIRQAGPRYEGPVAMSNDPDVLNSMGLIEAYQTVLDRGRDLSIDSNINHQGANAALMNVTSRIAGLYMLLGNEAYMDALDPTVGLGTSSALDSRAPAIFAFMNQFQPDTFGLIDEELGLLRGRDETLGGVAAAPTYNRLTWNFTNGDGEVAYVVNYNIKDMNQDGFVNEADAAIMYPQGHGDAWGHHLTAITKYYELLRHPSYTWVPRAEPVSVAGAPVVVDYYDERRFTTAAVAKARMGAEIVDLTFRKQYSDPDSQEYVDSHVDSSDDQRRAWGVADWARRAGQGAYFDWVMANAIIPPEDDRYSDVRKIDRTTVLDIGEIADQYGNIQNTLDDADQGLNPLGLVGDAVLFDLDPSLIAAGETHFEQVYERALNSLGNTLTLFDYANEVKLAQRASQDARRDFVTTIIEKDTALINQLIELFGYPYDADIGVNGTYPEGYDGPDIYNYDLWDRIELTDAEKRCSDEEVEYGHCDAELTTYTVEYWPLDCLGNYVEYLKDEDRAYLNEDLICPHVNRADEESDKLEIQYTVGVGLDKGRGRFKPASWPEDSSRKAVGDIQNAIQALNQARLEYELAIQVYQNHVIVLDATQKKIKERADMLKKKEDVKISTFVTFKAVDALIASAKEWALVSKKAAMVVDETTRRAANCPPTNNGFANDMMSAVRCGIEMAGLVSSSPMRASEFVAQTIQNFAPLGKDIIQGSLEIDLFKDENDWEIKNMGRTLGGYLLQEKELRLRLYLAKDKVNAAQGDYDQVLQRGFRKLQELVRLRKRWAGQISEQRYSDMAYRIFQNDALQKYRRQFDLAQTYTYLTAAAYDYEVNLSRDDPAIGDQFLRSIVGARTLGELRRLVPLPLEPVVGSGGLADPLGRMKDNFEVLKGQMGFNNPQTQASRFSLRHELLRLRESSDAKWRQELMRYYTPNIYNHDDVARLAKRPYGETGLQPGLVIPFGTNVTQGFNFFGRPLGPDDGAYNATQFVTKIASVGVWFEGYDTDRLARMPYAYLLPAGSDVIRPRDTSGTLRYWNITEQLLPLPHTIGQADMEDPTWIPRNDGLDGQLFAIKPYASFQAFPYTDTLAPSELNTDTRLIGRSVWNTEWVLVIPGSTLLADPQVGIERFIEDVTDVYIYFQTYAYAGN